MAVVGGEDLKLFFRGLIFGGIMPTEKHKCLFAIYSVFINVNVIALFPLTLIFDILKQDNKQAAMERLSAMLAIVAFSLKQVTMFFSVKQLRNMTDILQKLDQRIENSEGRQSIKRVSRLCKQVCFAWIGMVYTTVLVYTAGRLYSGHKLILSAWFPFDVQDEFKAWIAFTYQFIWLLFMSLQSVLHDIFPAISLILLTAHLKALKTRIKQIGEKNETADETFNQLVVCVEHHRTVLRLYAEISSVAKNILTLQFGVTTFCLCTEAVNIVLIPRPTFEKLTHYLEFAVFVLQVFPPCYCMNRVIEENAGLTESIYYCNWIVQDSKFKRALIIFMENTQEDLTLLVGNIIPVNLPTFVDIIKFSFSVYTLLNELNN